VLTARLGRATCIDKEASAAGERSGWANG
jgi:hypothetical protein